MSLGRIWRETVNWPPSRGMGNRCETWCRCAIGVSCSTSSHGGKRTLWPCSTIHLCDFWWWGSSLSRPRSMEFELYSLHVTPSNGPNLCIYVLYYVLCYIRSLCSRGFADATACMCWFGVWWGHGRDVHGWVRRLDVSPSTRRWKVEVYVSQDPPQEVPVLFGYIELSSERYTPNIYRCIHT